MDFCLWIGNTSYPDQGPLQLLVTAAQYGAVLRRANVDIIAIINIDTNTTISKNTISFLFVEICVLKFVVFLHVPTFKIR